MFKKPVSFALLLLCIIPSIASFAFRLPDTGQITCYDTSGAVIPCDGTGQDGAYDINPMSYTDNGNSTVTDNNTGLIWQQQDDTNSYNWYQASGTSDASYNPSSQNVCGSLKLAGYTDWRLPTEKELMSIVDYSVPYPGPTIKSAFFTNTQPSGYWSSTTSTATAGNAWDVYFGSGVVIDSGKAGPYYVRCVRGGQ